jgi:hypothetical protein
VPLPLPLDPLVMVIQVSLLVAVQLQPAETVTATLAAPPLDVALGFAGETLKLHVGDAAACVTVTV